MQSMIGKLPVCEHSSFRCYTADRRTLAKSGRVPPIAGRQVPRQSRHEMKKLGKQFFKHSSRGAVLKHYSGTSLRAIARIVAQVPIAGCVKNMFHHTCSNMVRYLTVVRTKAKTSSEEETINRNKAIQKPLTWPSFTPSFRCHASENSRTCSRINVLFCTDRAFKCCYKSKY